MTIVALTAHPNIEHSIHEALRHLDLTFLRGKRVAVKPNETWASVQDCSGVTQPDTLRAVLRYVKQQAPRELIVTGGAGSAQTDEVFRIAGLMQVVEEEGAQFVDHNRGPFVSVELDYGENTEVRGPQRSVMVNPRVLDYEALIAVNQLKLH
jgi:uncharacterized protein (DUF362 family)